MCELLRRLRRAAARGAPAGTAARDRRPVRAARPRRRLGVRRACRDRRRPAGGRGPVRWVAAERGGRGDRAGPARARRLPGGASPAPRCGCGIDPRLSDPEP